MDDGRSGEFVLVYVKFNWKTDMNEKYWIEIIRERLNTHQRLIFRLLLS